MSGDPVGCMNDKIMSDVGRNALAGGIIGAAAGGAIGLATRNPRVAIGAAAGLAAVGAGGAGLATYYLEHREADALQDIEASNRKLREELIVFERRNSELQANYVRLNQEVRASGGKISELAQQLKHAQFENDRFSRQAGQAFDTVRVALDDYTTAVLRKDGLISTRIRAEIDEYMRSRDVIAKDRDESGDRKAKINSLLEKSGLYETN